MSNQVEVSLEELFLVVGELEITRRKHNQQIQGLLKQADEMSQEITRLREENGRLVKANNPE